MHVDPENPQINNTTSREETPVRLTGNVVEGSQARKNRQFFHLALLITTALLTTTLWVSNTQTPAHADTQKLALAAPTATYCPPPNSDDSPDSGEHNSDDSSENSDFENFDARFPDDDPLSRIDRFSIWAYTTREYIDINQALRSGDPGDMREQAVAISDLNSALRKLPDHRGTVYRTARLSSDIISSYKKGEIVTEKAFLSASGKADVGSGNVRFIIDSKTGKDISRYSYLSFEVEILFSSGTRFKVDRKYRDRDDEWVIMMTEV